MSKKLVETLEKNIYLWVIVVYVLTGAKRSLATKYYKPDSSK